VAALRGLTRLRHLELLGADVEDLAPLADLTHLQKLYLVNSTGVRDLAPLTGLTQLQTLYLSSCTGVTDLAPLAALTQLQLLTLDDCTGLSAEAVEPFKQGHPHTDVRGP